jgi:hypothetical protein
MFEEITQGQFQEIMENLLGKDVWLGVYTDTISVRINYPEFEFLHFVKGAYQFGHMFNGDGENELNYQNIEINVNEIISIHRDTMSLTVEAEQIVLELIDGVQLILECNC